MRYPIKRSWWLRPLLVLLGGATRPRSYVELESEALRVRYGWFFRNDVPLAEIESVEPARWPWYAGLGLRADFVGVIAAVASYDNVVLLRLRRKRKMQSILPFLRLSCDRLFVSLEESDAFISALRGRLRA